MHRFYMIPILCFAFIVFAGCDSTQKKSGESIMTVEVEDVEGLSDLEEVEIDQNGSMKITSEDKTVLQLANTGDIDVEDSLLIYRAKIKTENLDGKVYLEMWCSFKGKGSYFSKAIENALSGTNDWTVQETPFFLKKGENPDDIKLNVVVEGKGTVWLDDIELLKRPLK